MNARMSKSKVFKIAENKKLQNLLVIQLKKEKRFLSVQVLLLSSLLRELPIDNIRVVTNSLPVFIILNERKLTDLILIGGNYREITGAFVGTLTLQDIESLQYSKAFVSCNGIKDHAIATFSEDEGEVQKLAIK